MSEGGQKAPVETVPAAEIGKREFVRALSVDEAESGEGSASAVAPTKPMPDLQYPTLNTEVHPSGWFEPEATHLSVRDVNYLKDKKKVKSLPSVFDCVCCEMYQVHKPLRKVAHAAVQPFTQFRHLVKQPPKNVPYRGAPGSNFTFIINFQAPGYGLTMYYQRKKDERVGSEGGGAAFESAFKAFLEGDLKYKTRHLKFFPVVTEGGWIVRKVVGGKPAIIAKKIDCVFFEGPNYFECDVDVSTSSVAKNILRVVKSYAKKIVFDLAWGFEGKTVEHLPERIMGITRFERVHVDILPVVPNELVVQIEEESTK